MGLQRRTAPPIVHLRALKAQIAASNTCLTFPTAAAPLAVDSRSEKLHAGVSSFGFGGTLAHAVLSVPLEAGPSAPTATLYATPQPFWWPRFDGPQAPDAPLPVLSTDHEHAEFVRTVATAVAEEVLGRSVDPGRSLVNQGIDSLTSVAFRDELQKRLRKPLPASLIFDHPTIDAIATFLATLAAPPGSAARPPSLPPSQDRPLTQ